MLVRSSSCALISHDVRSQNAFLDDCWQIPCSLLDFPGVCDDLLFTIRENNIERQAVSSFSRSHCFDRRGVYFLRISHAARTLVSATMGKLGKSFGSKMV